MTDAKRPKFENTIRLDLNPAVLWVIDFNVMVHDILSWYEAKIEGSFKPETSEKLLKGVWALYLNRGPQFLKRHPYRVVVIADYRDPSTGNYWRDDFMRNSSEVQNAWVGYAESQGVELSSLPTHYKGTRGPKTDGFYTVYNVGKDYCQKYFPWFWQLSYEADDIAGSIARLCRLADAEEVIKKRQILLHTLDRDWAQLVCDSNRIYFSNSRQCRPKEKIQEQLQGEQGIREWAEHKMKVKLNHPSEMAAHKAVLGDMCDNAVMGSPIELFDLIHPHPEWNIDKILWDDEFRNCMNDPEANTRPDHYEQSLRQFAKINLEIPIRV